MRTRKLRIDVLKRLQSRYGPARALFQFLSTAAEDGQAIEQVAAEPESVTIFGGKSFVLSPDYFAHAADCLLTTKKRIRAHSTGSRHHARLESAKSGEGFIV